MRTAAANGRRFAVVTHTGRLVKRMAQRAEEVLVAYVAAISALARPTRIHGRAHTLLSPLLNARRAGLALQPSIANAGCRSTQGG